jgi:hypothetical protein
MILDIFTPLHAREFLVYKELVKPETQTLIQEIALAMFRVASVAKHEGVKSSLENLAVKIVAEGDPEYIVRAESLITLGRETGDIKEINAAVLLRELAALKEVLAPEVAADVDISSMFSPAVPSTTPTPSATPASFSVIPAPAGIHSPHTSSPKPKVAKPSYGLVQLSVDGENISSKPRNNGVKKHNSINADKVYEYIEEHRVARLKELEAAFKEVSGRTVRRITDSLIKDGRIERVGNPGPTSFYRPRIIIPRSPLAASPSPANSVPTPTPSVTPASPSVIPAEAGIQSLHSFPDPTSIIAL